MRKEGCDDVEDKEEEEEEARRWKENYQNLVTNIVLTSNMELLPYSHAVGKVTGLRDEIQGPGDKCFFVWNSIQKFITDNPPEKALLDGDFGVGKSMLLHHRLLTLMRDYPGRKTFLISFLNATSGGNYKRGV